MRASSSEATRTMMETGSGLFFDFAAPAPEHITLEDVAQALSNTCRFGGHCQFYSVAEHALFVSRLVAEHFHRPDLALAALHHDSHEAYVGDIPTPWKVALGPVYLSFVVEIDAAICAALALSVEDLRDPVVKAADEIALRIEAARLKRSRGIEGAWPWRELPNMDLAPRVFGLTPESAQHRFLVRHRRLSA